jgi:hypothetical protein
LGTNLYAACKGSSLDQNLYYASFNGSVWSQWTRIPHVGSSIGPAIATFGNDLYAMWKGVGGDQALYYASFNGTAWSSAATIPGNTGQDFVPVPEGGLMGNSNYMIYSNCTPLQNLSVTIEITEEISFGSVTPSSATKGFSFQWNGYSPAGARCSWLQFNIGVDMSNPAQSTVIGAVEYWPSYIPNGSDLLNQHVPLKPIPGPTIPAGYKFKISLGCDDTGTVNSATFAVTDQHGNAQPPQVLELLKVQLDGSLATPQVDPQFLPGPVTQRDLAPVYAIELNLVAHDSGAAMVLKSGAGTFTYSASNQLTATNYQPSCTSAQGVFTAENGNSVYGALPASPSSTLTQSFKVNTANAQPQTLRPGTPRASIWKS